MSSVFMFGLTIGAYGSFVAVAALSVGALDGAINGLDVFSAWFTCAIAKFATIVTAARKFSVVTTREEWFLLVAPAVVLPIVALLTVLVVGVFGPVLNWHMIGVASGTVTIASVPLILSALAKASAP